MFNKKLQKVFLGSVMAVAMSVSVMPVGIATEAVAATEADLQIMGVTIDQVSPQKQGTRVSISADVIGGTGELKYTYMVKLPGSNTFETIAEDTCNEYVNYTLNEVGVYNFHVKVKDAYEVVSDIQEFTVIPASVKINSVKLNKKSFSVKDTVKFTVNATPSEGTVKSKIVVTTPSGKKVTVKKLSAKKTASYVVKKKGTYTATVTACDKSTSVSKKVSFKVSK